VKVGIIGLPNAGKSTLFNALTRAGAQAANYPFTTIEPNVAIVPVVDERLERVAALLGASGVVHDTIEVHDIAGLVAGAHRGEGLGNKFLGHIRETDALLHVVRAHGDEGVVHPEGRVDPVRDIETVDTELLYSDLEQAERRLERVVRKARSGERAAMAEQAWLQRLIEALGAGRPARTVPPPVQAPDALRELGPLTAKPVLYVANVGEEAEGSGGTSGTQETGAGAPAPETGAVPPAGAVPAAPGGVPVGVPPAIAAHADAVGARAIALSARLEAELGELDAAEETEMRAELGAGEPGVTRVVSGAFELLDLIAFFTAGEAKPAQSWHVSRGSSAWSAAGRIHSDIQRGFVRAEVVGWTELIDAGGYAGARDRGTLRIEGRDYVMADGDVMTVRFTP